MRARLDPTLHIDGNGGHPRHNGGGAHRPLAIVGSHPATRENAPFDDPRFEIWLFNEAPLKTEVYHRWDAVLQLHRPEVYTSLENWVNKGYWGWLQQDHGPDKRIFMIDVDPRVPNSVRYPLEGVLGLVPYHYLRSSPAEALALAIYLGYQEIWLYGSELTSNTEYTYQAVNYAFWIGYAHGLGIDLHLECWQSEFFQPLYGFEGEAQIEKDFYEERFREHEQTWKLNQSTLDRLKALLDQAMLDAKFDKVGDLVSQIELAAQVAGENAGAMAEAARYLNRSDMIRWHAGGKVEYVWNVWRQTGSIQALAQLRKFTAEKFKLAYEMGEQLGRFNENMRYLVKYDEGVTAMGGVRALVQMGVVADG